jgi:hypothetical protein
MLRISALAVGIAFPESIGGIDVMEQPWHDLVGLAALAVGSVPIVWWARRQLSRRAHPSSYSSPGPTDSSPGPTLHPSDDSEHEPVSFSRRHKIIGALCLCTVGAALFFAPPMPVDVATSTDAIALPDRLGANFRHDLPLTDLEREYFGTYGGATAKAQYGPMVLLVVRTSSPLRHMHAPDECLAGAGHDVETVGMRGRVFPGATYRTTDPRNRNWLVRVSYVSEHGERAGSVTEVVWKWLQSPTTTWTAIERIYPADLDPARRAAFEASVMRAFELSPDSLLNSPTTPFPQPRS